MIFHYKARTVDGAESIGTLDAPDERTALAELAGRNLLVTKISRSGNEWGLQSDVRFLTWIPARLFNAFLLQLSVMIRAGVPLVEALSSLETGETHRTFRRIIGDVRKEVEQGRMFSEALSTHPEVFDTFFVNMVRIGETGGVLDKVLVKLASMQQRTIALRNQILGALAYPTLLVVVASVVLFILFSFALPKFAEVFKQAHFPMPTPTRIVLAVGDFCRDYNRFLIGLGIITVLLAFLSALTARGRALAGEVGLKLPVIREVVRSYLIVHISESLGMLLNAGVPLLELLGSVEQTLNMPTARGTLESMRNYVERGSTMRMALEGSVVFPAMALKLIETGEKTGTLDRMFNEIAGYYDDNLQTSLKAALSLLEPLLIFGMACIVGFIMLAVILPIFQMSQAFRGSISG